MAIIPRLELRHSQSLVMTPQLQQAIKLLQFSNVELQEFVEEELAENPMLDRDESDLEPTDGNGPEDVQNDIYGEEEFDPGDNADAPDNLDAMDLGRSEHLTEDKTGALDMEEYDNVWDTESGPTGGGSEAFSDWSAGGSGGSFDPDAPDFQQNLSQESSLRDHLFNQIQLEIDDPAERMIAGYLTDMLDETGRLPTDLTEARDALDCTDDAIDAVLTKLQRFEPSGLYARNLAECWAIQLRELDRLDPAMAALLDNIDLLKNHDYQALCKVCQVDMEDMQDMVAELRALNHNPTEEFEHIEAQPIVPDVIMRAGAEGKWVVELNSDTLPKVLVNQAYYAEISKSVRTKDEKQYVTDKIQSANWLVKSLHQRATTILKVASEIVSQQEAFFRLGVEHLKPLILRDIAEEIEMHESTVSRVTSNKYILTPRGIFELKYFFTSAIGSTDGGAALSAESVKHKIKTLIDAEEPAAILSDDKIVEILNEGGVDIARRTVAKYREALKIPSSIQRRREKKRAVGF